MEFMQVAMFLLAVAESAVVHTHIQLCHEDYNWWWNSFYVGASPALWLFLEASIRVVF
jgi:transmembrane 9 superfamily protein 2/4